MEKEIIVKEIGDSLEIDTDYTCGDKLTDINVVNDFVNQAIKNGANSIKFSGTTEHDTYTDLETLEMQPVHVSEESDEAFEKRKIAFMQSELDREKKREMSERATYNRLKEKYG